nr:restriction endonuclease subunit S [uncultured Bacteroides sp.]
MNKILKDICVYVKERIDISLLYKDNYVSTENMLPQKGGIVRAANLPSTSNTSKYAEGDILISNIRPYFQKIWHANNAGGCSNDVLVLRAKKGYYPKFLYYLLSEKSFFDYATTTAKGTKMPRGDKEAIMNYKVYNINYTEQIKIASILSSLDEKIEVNKLINDNLAT